MQNDEIMTLQETAEFLKVSERTVHYYISKGLLTELRNPEGKGPIRFRSEEVKKFFREKAESYVQGKQPDQKP